VSDPASYIAEALRDVGLTAPSVTITDYRPDFFGNLVANVDTNIGPLVILYDRGFCVSSTAELADATLKARMIQALEYRRKMASGVEAKPK